MEWEGLSGRHRGKAGCEPTLGLSTSPEVEGPGLRPSGTLCSSYSSCLAEKDREVERAAGSLVSSCLGFQVSGKYIVLDVSCEILRCSAI